MCRKSQVGVGNVTAWGSPKLLKRCDDSFLNLLSFERSQLTTAVHKECLQVGVACRPCHIIRNSARSMPSRDHFIVLVKLLRLGKVVLADC